MAFQTSPYAHFIHSGGILWLFKLHHMPTSFILVGFYGFSKFTCINNKSSLVKTCSPDFVLPL